MEELDILAQQLNKAKRLSQKKVHIMDILEEESSENTIGNQMKSSYFEKLVENSSSGHILQRSQSHYSILTQRISIMKNNKPEKKSIFSNASQMIINSKTMKDSIDDLNSSDSANPNTPSTTQNKNSNSIQSSGGGRFSMNQTRQSSFFSSQVSSPGAYRQSYLESAVSDTPKTKKSSAIEKNYTPVINYNIYKLINDYQNYLCEDPQLNLKISDLNFKEQSFDFPFEVTLEIILRPVFLEKDPDFESKLQLYQQKDSQQFICESEDVRINKQIQICLELTKLKEQIQLYNWQNIRVEIHLSRVNKPGVLKKKQPNPYMGFFTFNLFENIALKSGNVINGRKQISYGNHQVPLMVGVNQTPNNQVLLSLSLEKSFPTRKNQVLDSLDSVPLNRSRNVSEISIANSISSLQSRNSFSII